MVFIEGQVTLARLRFLVRFVPKAGLHYESLLNIARSLAANLGAEARNPKRISYGALELDVFARSEADLRTLVAAIEPVAKVEFIHDLGDAAQHLDKGDAVKLAASYFNQERFWESHEILESVWRVSSGPEKALLQGVILVDAAFVHVQKSEPLVAIGVLRRALRLLNWNDRFYQGIDVAKLRRRVERIIAEGKFRLFRL